MKLTFVAVYTFLVTLVILLIICSGLILRTYMLRRWHRRMIEQGIVNGTYVPSVRNARKIAKKPRLHDVHLVFASVPDRMSEVGGTSEKDAPRGTGDASCWDDILVRELPHGLRTLLTRPQPLSLRVVCATPKVSTVKSEQSMPSPQLWSWSRFGFHRPQQSPVPTTPSLTFAFSPVSPSSQYSTPRTPPSPPTPSVADLVEDPEPAMDVAVLICMPHDASRRQSLFTASQQDGSTSSDFPQVEFGIASVRLEAQREE